MDLFAIKEIEDDTLKFLLPQIGQFVRFKAQRAKWVSAHAKLIFTVKVNQIYK